jgi:hypothetical protein
MTTILIKKKDTAGAPAPGDLTNAAGGAELAVNTATKRLYTKDSGGNIVEVGTNPSTIDATTVNTTNLEVTNLKAKDGTAAGSIANSTGVVTLASTVLTTADINGGSIDGTAIGVATPSTGAFTTLTASSTATLNTFVSSGVTVTGGTINGTTIGASTATTGTFTTLTATADSAFTSTGALAISKGTTAERPGSPTASMLRFNTQTTEFEGYNGTVWASVGGAAISNDTSTASNLYPLFANATSGTASTVYTGNAKLLYKPSTGELQSTALVASNGIVVNGATVSSSYTIATGNNASSAGPITVDSGVSVTVSSGSRWVVL